MGSEINRSIKRLRLKDETSQLFKTTSNYNGLGNGQYLDRQSWPYVYHRVFGYSIGAAVHLTNVLAMALTLRGPIMKDPDVDFFYSMRFFYLTIWNLGFQILYVGMGLACDLPILLKMKDSKFLNTLRWYRKTFYSGILWPFGMGIVTIFWPIYSYDRNLIFPDYVDKAVSQISNYIMHMFIAFPILWDLFFLPNQKPSSQKYTSTHCGAISLGYLVVLFGHYSLRGKWPYPVLKQLYGTIYFPLIFKTLIVLLVFIYLLQWSLISAIWPKKQTKST